MADAKVAEECKRGVECLSVQEMAQSYTVRFMLSVLLDEKESVAEINSTRKYYTNFHTAYVAPRRRFESILNPAYPWIMQQNNTAHCFRCTSR